MYLFRKIRWRKVVAVGAIFLLLMTAVVSVAPCLSFRFTDEVGWRTVCVVGLTEVAPLCCLTFVVPLVTLYLVMMPMKAANKVLMYLPLMILHGVTMGICFSTIASWLADGARLLVGFGVYCGLAVLSNLATAMALYAEVELIEKG